METRLRKIPAPRYDEAAFDRHGVRRLSGWNHPDTATELPLPPDVTFRRQLVIRAGSYLDALTRNAPDPAPDTCPLALRAHADLYDDTELRTLLAAWRSRPRVEDARHDAVHQRLYARQAWVELSRFGDVVHNRDALAAASDYHPQHRALVLTPTVFVADSCGFTGSRILSLDARWSRAELRDALTVGPARGPLDTTLAALAAARL